MVCVDTVWHTRCGRWRSELSVHAYQLELEGAAGEGIEEGGEVTRMADQWLLPNRCFQGLWDSLVYEEGLKESLLSYAQTVLTGS